MADFWIKVEKGTPDKPEVLEMASILGIEDPDTVTGKLIRAWSWFDSNSENGHAPSVTNVLLDRLTGVTGFTAAMVDVGWLSINEDGSYQMGNFDRHIGKGAKKRASDAERKRLSRQKSAECHNPSVTDGGQKAGPDKSRVEKSREYKEQGATASQSPLQYQSFVDAYHELLPSMPAVQVLSDKRKRAIKNFVTKRTREAGVEFTLENWKAYCSYINHNCGWMMESRPRGDGTYWKPKNLDYILKDDCYTSVKEERADDA